MRHPKVRRALSRAACIESLEARQLLAAPVIDAVADTTIPAGKSLILPLTASDADGDVVTWTVASSDPAIVPTVHTNNTWLKMSVAGFGDMIFELLRDVAPNTADTIGGLAQSGFYDGLIFHRVIPGFVIQGGDPLGTGTGGPGFQFDDEFNAKAIFTGTYQLAMAKSGDDTNGSQFFVTLAQTRNLDFQHTIFGQLVRGSSVADAIAAVPRNASDKPDTDVVISSVRYVDDNTDAVITLNTTGALAAPATITLTATDVHGEQTTRTFQVNTPADATDDNPFMGPIPRSVTTPVDTPITIPIPSTDLEGTTVGVSGEFLDAVSNANATGAINADNSITITTSPGYTGPIQIAIGVSQFNVPFAYTPGDTNYDQYAQYWDAQAITIAVGDQPVSLTANSIKAPAGAAVSGVIATFTDSDPNGAVADYVNAAVNWGDGHLTSNATIARLQDGSFTITAGNTYSNPGVYPILVTLTSALGQVLDGRAAAAVYAARGDEAASIHIAGTLAGVAPGSAITVRYDDGAVAQTTLDGNSGYSLDHIFADDGLYEVTLTPANSNISAPVIPVLVDNVAPITQITGPTTGSAHAAVTLGLTTTDSAVDTAVGFAYLVDWNDNTPIQQVPPHTSITHTYAAAGAYTVFVTATDKDGATSAIASHPLTIVPGAAQLQPDPVTPGKLALVVTGTSGNDTITVSPAKSGQVKVLFGSTLIGLFKPTGRIQVFGGSGNDTITISRSVTFVADLFGAKGNDILNGGDANDILVGGPGNDVLLGNGGRDILLGGSGADKLTGGAGDDILLADSSTFDANSVALGALQAEWTRSATYAVRVGHITGGAGGLNSTTFLKAPAITKDTFADTLTGSADSDLFLLNSAGTGTRDKATDRIAAETLKDLA